MRLQPRRLILAPAADGCKPMLAGILGSKSLNFDLKVDSERVPEAVYSRKERPGMDFHLSQPPQALHSNVSVNGKSP